MSERFVTTIGGLDGLDVDEGLIRRKKRRRRVLVDPTNAMLGMGVQIGLAGEDQGVETTTPAPKSPPPAKPSSAAWAAANGTYILQSGDTLWGLASTYLLNGARWKEIWALQPSAYTSGKCGPYPKRSPDHVCAGDVVAMPKEAIDRARGMGLLPPEKKPMGKPAAMIASVLASGVVSYIFGAKGA